MFCPKKANKDKLDLPDAVAKKAKCSGGGPAVPVILVVSNQCGCSGSFQTFV